MPPNGALQKANEAAVVYRGARQFVFVTAGAAVLAVVTIAAVVVGHPVSLLLGPMALFLAFLAGQHCSQVELCGNGDLVLRFFVRRGITTTVEAVSSIDRDDEDGEWCVSFDEGTFRMSPNRSATSLVHALMRRRPTIALTGYRLPKV